MASHKLSQGRSWTQVLYEAEAKFNFTLQREKSTVQQDGTIYYSCFIYYTPSGQATAYLASSQERNEKDACEVAAYKAACQLKSLGYQWKW
jgi:hypothetical protein